MTMATSTWKAGRRAIAFAVVAGTLLVSGFTPVALAGEKFGIIVANEAYRHTSPVDFAKRDADAIEAMMVGPLGIPRRNITRIDDATLSDLRRLVGDTRGSGRVASLPFSRDSELFVYFAGHGSKELRPGEREADAYLLGVDTYPDDLRRTGLSLDDLVNRLKELQSARLPDGRTTLILESCFSGRSHVGELITGSSAPVHGPPILVSSTQSGAVADNFTIMAAAQGTQYAVWDTEYRQSVFTDALVSALSGEADEAAFGGDDDGTVTLGEMQEFVEQRVARRLNAVRRGVRQVPDISGGTADRVLAKVDDNQRWVELERRRHRERLRSGQLLAGGTNSDINAYLASCIYCPRRSALREKVRTAARDDVICTLEDETAGPLLKSGTAPQIRFFLEDCQCCSRKAELEAALALLEGKSAPQPTDDGADSSDPVANAPDASAPPTDDDAPLFGDIDPGAGDGQGPVIADPVLPDPPSASGPSVRTETPRIGSVGKWPEGIGFDGTDLWIAESGQRTIAEFDPDDLRVQRRIKIGRLPVDMVSLPNGNVLIDVRTDTVIKQRKPGSSRAQRLASPGGYVDGMKLIDGTVWMLNWPEGSSGSIRIDRMNTGNGRVSKGRVLRKDVDYRGNNLDYTVVANSEAWVVFHDGEVQVFDTNSWRKRTELEVPDRPTGTHIETLGSRVAIGGFMDPYGTGTGRVTIYNADYKEVIAQYEIPRGVSAMTTAQGRFIVADAVGDVYVFDAADGRWLQHIQLTQPLSSPKAAFVLGDRLYMTIYDSGVAGGDGAGRVAMVRWDDGN